MTLYYLSSNEVSIMNAFQIENYSPEEQMGIKDINALEMAVNQPSQNVYGQELYSSIEEKAAILMINLIKKHPFFNANKRTAMMAADIFLQFNGLNMQYEIDNGVDLVVKIATYESENFEGLKNFVTESIKRHIVEE
ncbi:type II toxin-antitoxin system death-on-curing family toxin [Enterococcus pingfangensis]